MKFGVNLLLFGDAVDEKVTAQFAALKEMGFDGVEIPIFDPPSMDLAGIKEAADKAGLLLTATGALPPGTNFYSDSDSFDKAASYIRGLTDASAALGSPVAAGPLYKAVGDMDESVPLEKQRDKTAQAMKELCAYAEEKHVVLAFECLNRFETNFMNIAEQGISFCKAVGSPSAGLLLDTFHMHIEEKNTAEAVKKAQDASVFAHFHASENDRGVAGSGQVRWQEVAAAVKDCGYDSWCVLESFSQTCEAIRTAVSCWRPFYPSEEEFLKNGLSFVKGLFT